MAYEELISSMTLEEKCALLSGGDAFGTYPMARHAIPRMQFSDGPHGLRVQAAGANHLGIGGSLPATCFPTAATVANSWNPKLGEALGEALGEEALAQKVDVVLGPGLNIKRNPLCGRNFEYFSEDPLLAGKMAAGYVRGIQSKGVSACPKHFAVNSQETRRMASDSVVDERTLREIYLAGFERVVEEAHPACIMSSYNLVNGTYVNEDPYLLRQILRDEWGFDGAVVTDWVASHDHPAAVKCGSDFEMPAPGIGSVRELVEAVRDGRVSESVIDARVEECLKLIFATTAHTRAAGSEFDAQAHHRLAETIAAESCVLLKNQDALLPLAPGTKVALVGDFAAEPRYQGAGSSLVNSVYLNKLVDCIRDYDLDYVGFEPGFDRCGPANAEKAADACQLASRADVVLLCLGLDETRETEGAERQDMCLASSQVALVGQLAAVNPNIAVLLSAGAPVETGWDKDVKALVHLCLGGQAGARAALDVVCGLVNPSGKLAETWPHALADTATAGSYPAEKKHALYKEALYVGYRYFDSAQVDVAYPFGFGLSYTTFDYSDLKVSVADGPDPKVAVSCAVANTGPVAGAEVVQLYVAKPEGDVFRPAQELRAFDKVVLEPGQSARVSFELSGRDFAYYHVGNSDWEIEGGTYELRVSASSRDVRLSGAVELSGTGAANPYEGLDVEVYRCAQVSQVSDEAFAAILGHPVPSPKVTLGPDLCIRDLNHGRSPLFWLVWLILDRLVKASYKKGAPDLNLLFIYNMPLHGLAKNAGGLVSPQMIDALVLEIRGFWVVGLLLFIGRFFTNLAKNSRIAAALKEAAAKAGAGPAASHHASDASEHDASAPGGATFA